MSVSVQNPSRATLGSARRVYSLVAEKLLPSWELSLVFVGPKKAAELNRSLRMKSYTPNVLSYVVGKKSGEIIICPSIAAKQAPDYQLSTTSYLLLLFIHGVLHIKGWAHGARMEACERTLLARYGSGSPRTLSTHGSQNRNRHRHRDVPGKDGRRRRALR